MLQVYIILYQIIAAQFSFKESVDFPKSISLKNGDPLQTVLYHTSVLYRSGINYIIRLYVEQYHLIQELCVGPGVVEVNVIAGVTDITGVMDITDVADITDAMDITDVSDIVLQELRALHELRTLQELRTLRILRELLSDIWPIIRNRLFILCSIRYQILYHSEVPL